jgi:hypothetical protein
MDQSAALANTDFISRHRPAMSSAAFDAQSSLIDSANEFAFSIDFHQQ